MTYATKDTSVHDGEPIECYEFIGTHKTWRYTSYHDTVTLTIDGVDQDFEPLPITRTAIDIGSVIDSIQTMDFNIPSDHEIARTYCYTVSPKDLEVKVYRTHAGDLADDYKCEWTGGMAGHSATGKWATIETASKLQTALNGPLSSIFYQRSCNHVLYDERCQAVRADFTVSATVTKIQGQIITVDDMGYPADELEGGSITNLRTGEVQGILTNENDEIRIGWPFFDLLVGDTVELTLGCDHLRLGHCKNRFDNVVHYGGFDFIPDKNPFEQLQLKTTTSTTTTVRQEQTNKVQMPWNAKG